MVTNSRGKGGQHERVRVYKRGKRYVQNHAAVIKDNDRRTGVLERQRHSPARQDGGQRSGGPAQTRITKGGTSKNQREGEMDIRSGGYARVGILRMRGRSNSNKLKDPQKELMFH